MRTIRSRIAGPAAALVACSAALAVIGSTGAAASAAQAGRERPAAIAGVSWHKLSLLGGWKPSSSSSTGAPSWAVKGRVVYLSGALRQPVAGGPAFARLPKAERPTRRLYISVYTLDNTMGFVLIDPDGTMLAYSSPASNAQDYTSLAGVSFPAASMARHKLALPYGWASAQAGDDTGDPAYSVSGGVAYLSGSAYQRTGSSTIIGFLPKVASPAHTMYLTVYTLDGTVGEISIESDGAIQAFGTWVTSFVSLAGVSFPVAKTARHKLKLLHGWTADPGLTFTGAPSYSVINGVVHLSGVTHQLSGSNAEFAVLPRGDRPRHTMFIQTYNSASTPVTLWISPNGQMLAVSTPNYLAPGLTSLDAISFPINS